MSELKPAQLDNQSLQQVLDVTRQLAKPCDLATVLEEVINAGRHVLGVDRGTVYLFDAANGQLYSTVATGVDQQQIRFGINQGIAGLCARTRQVVNVADCYSDPRFSPEFDLRTGYQTRCLINAPLVGLDDELVGVLQLINPTKGVFEEQDERLIGVLASQAAVAIQRTRLLEERMIKLKMERDLDLARQIQQGVLPKELPSCPGYELACYSQPAEQTGGDIYDVVALGGADSGGSPPRLVLFLADAVGHGIGSALSVTQARAMLRMGLRLTTDLPHLVDQMNRQLAQDLTNCRFITAFVGILDPEQHHLHYFAAGQGPILQYHAAEQRCTVQLASGPPLGLVVGPLDNWPQPINFLPGDMLVLLTDGFYEHRSPSGQQFGKDRTEKIIQQHHGESAGAVLDAILRHLQAFAEVTAPSDDLTGLVLKRQW